MRRFRISLLACGLAAVLVAAAPDARAQDGGSRAPHSTETATDGRIDQLFARLAQTESAAEARGVALLIQRRWLESGSPTADLLMNRAREAMRARDPALAIELIDRVLVIEPGWAEAWNRRAIAFTMLDDPVSAIADIYRVVSLEPRHFAAWAGLGNLLMQAGDERGALESFERALAIHPHLPRIETIVGRLAREVDGVEL
ncbi:tetratricopeptide repeat protein [Salinarimonas sp. NSM]|uniref:tetratricopeptide repeat protein n=1 Tax=Salinarimonas sp. NSM TaxID=3458003 RepID=UPI004036FE27